MSQDASPLADLPSGSPFDEADYRAIHDITRDDDQFAFLVWLHGNGPVTVEEARSQFVAIQTDGPGEHGPGEGTDGGFDERLRRYRRLALVRQETGSDDTAIRSTDAVGSLVEPGARDAVRRLVEDERERTATDRWAAELS